ncbi:hypothetical protein FB451DRAFT_1551269 [Mycena latifolia]|nr:hypothetical protein FB451DRAFT_1551269 [Mycena latifolia]
MRRQRAPRRVQKRGDARGCSALRLGASTHPLPCYDQVVRVHRIPLQCIPPLRLKLRVFTPSAAGAVHGVCIPCTLSVDPPRTFSFYGSASRALRMRDTPWRTAPTIADHPAYALWIHAGATWHPALLTARRTQPSLLSASLISPYSCGGTPQHPSLLGPRSMGPPSIRSDLLIFPSAAAAAQRRARAFQLRAVSRDIYISAPLDTYGSHAGAPCSGVSAYRLALYSSALEPRRLTLRVFTPSLAVAADSACSASSTSLPAQTMHTRKGHKTPRAPAGPRRIPTIALLRLVYLKLSLLALHALNARPTNPSFGAWRSPLLGTRRYLFGTEHRPK